MSRTAALSAKRVTRAPRGHDGQKALVRLLAELLVDDYLAEREREQKAGSPKNTVSTDCHEQNIE